MPDVDTGRPKSLAGLLAEVIEFLYVGDNFAELAAMQLGLVYAAGDEVQKDLAEVIMVLLANPELDARLYRAAFDQGAEVEEDNILREVSI